MAKMAKLTMPVLAFLIFIGTPDVRMTRGSHEMGIILTPNGHMESVDDQKASTLQVTSDPLADLKAAKRKKDAEAAENMKHVRNLEPHGPEAQNTLDLLSKGIATKEGHTFTGAEALLRNGAPINLGQVADGNKYIQEMRAGDDDKLATAAAKTRTAEEMQALTARLEHDPKAAAPKKAGNTHDDAPAHFDDDREEAQKKEAQRKEAQADKADECIGNKGIAKKVCCAKESVCDDPTKTNPCYIACMAKVKTD